VPSIHLSLHIFFRVFLSLSLLILVHHPFYNFFSCSPLPPLLFLPSLSLSFSLLVGSVTFDSLSELDLASQLTLLESDLFHRIRPRELLGQCWSRKDKETRAANVLALISNFNKVPPSLFLFPLSFSLTLSLSLFVFFFFFYRVYLLIFWQLGGTLDHFQHCERIQRGAARDAPSEVHSFGRCTCFHVVLVGGCCVVTRTYFRCVLLYFYLFFAFSFMHV
jgi:RasGEF domain